MGDILDQGAKKRAQDSAELQEQQLAEQTKKEQLRASEEDDATARRKIAGKSGGRKSLLATSETGLSKTLG